jgi:hypothetical protein
MASLWIDDFAGHFGTVVILGAMLAGSLYWLLGAREGCSTSSLKALGCDVEPILFCEARLHNSHLIGGYSRASARAFCGAPLSQVANSSSCVSKTGILSWLMVATNWLGVVVRKA